MALADDATLWEAVTRGAACAAEDAVLPWVAAGIGDGETTVEDAGAEASGQAAPVGKADGLCKSAAAADESRLVRGGEAAPSGEAATDGGCCAMSGVKALAVSGVRVCAVAGADHAG